jgi:hypothetical protein
LRAYAFTCLAVVILRKRAVCGDVIASVGETAPASVILECQAYSAVVIGEATGRNIYASLLLSAPALTGIAQTLECHTVVTVRALGRNVIASISDLTQSSSCLESEAFAAVIVGFAAGRDSDA